MHFEPALRYQSQVTEAPKNYTEAMRQYFLLPQDSRLLKITVKGGKLKLASSNCSSNYQSQREEQHYKPMSQRVKYSAERQSSAGGSAVASERGETTNPP
jgi:hypothetical protein